MTLLPVLAERGLWKPVSGGDLSSRLDLPPRER